MLWLLLIESTVAYLFGIIIIIGQPVSLRVADDSSSSLQVPAGSRNRVLTHHMRELARGKFLLSSEDITLLDCIGEGIHG